MTEYEALDELTRLGQEMGDYDPPVSKDGLLPCPRCKRTLTLHADVDCAVKCDCGYLGPISKNAADAAELWNRIKR